MQAQYPSSVSSVRLHLLRIVGRWAGHLDMAHGGMNATRVEVRALQLDLPREEEQLREATRLTDKRKV